MRTREVYYCDYDITEEECHAWKKRCREDAVLEMIMREAAEEANKDIADILFESLKKGISYEKLDMRHYIPIGKQDFYGYQRKMLFLVREKCMKQDESVQAYFRKERVIRRYCTIKEARNELGVELKIVEALSKEAAALVKLGRYTRVDMGKLYDYIDRECTQETIGSLA